MDLKPISFEKLLIRPTHLWDIQTLLLTCGDYITGHYNTMTVGWGSIGYMWRRPFVQVVVRPARYTYEFMQQYDTFSLCALQNQYRKALDILGTKSGRDGNKIAEAGLNPIPGKTIPAPGFSEAELIIECRKIYWDDLEPGHFIDPGIANHYPGKDYHRIYFGEITYILGTEKFKQSE